MIKKLTIIILTAIMSSGATAVYFNLNKLPEKNSQANLVDSLPSITPLIITPTPSVTGTIPSGTPESTPSGGWKTFHFNNFHGDVINEVFSFKYPGEWYNNGQYFSPNKIEYYDMTSVDAPIFYDLISEDLFDTSDTKYQIDKDKRRQPDTHGKIDGKEFKKYDLIDYGTYGESSGRVMIFVGPKISIDGRVFYLVFRWEEKPLTITIPGNSPEIFEKMVNSIKFN